RKVTRRDLQRLRRKQTNGRTPVLRTNIDDVRPMASAIEIAARPSRPGLGFKGHVGRAGCWLQLSKRIHRSLSQVDGIHAEALLRRDVNAYCSLSASVGSMRRLRRAGPSAARKPTAIIKNATAGRTISALPRLRSPPAAL